MNAADAFQLVTEILTNRSGVDEEITTQSVLSDDLGLDESEIYDVAEFISREHPINVDLENIEWITVQDIIDSLCD